VLVASSAVVLSDLAVLTIDGGRDSGELEAALASSIVVPDAFVVVAADLVDIIDDCDDGILDCVVVNVVLVSSPLEGLRLLLPSANSARVSGL
jgi:hypothetical protein